MLKRKQHTNCRPVRLNYIVPVISETGAEYTLIRYECSWESFIHDTWVYYHPSFNGIAAWLNVPGLPDLVHPDKTLPLFKQTNDGQHS